MKMQEKSPSSGLDDSGILSPNNQNSQPADDQDFLQTASSQPWHSKFLINYLGINPKKPPVFKILLYVLGTLFFLFLLKRVYFDSNTKNAYYTSYTPNRHIIKTYTTPFFDLQFDNPTSHPEISQPSINKEDYIPKLQLSCYLYSHDHLNIIIRDADKIRYELPHEHPFPYPKHVNQSLLPEESGFTMYFEFEPFNLIIKRKLTEEILFDLTDRFIYTNFYLELSFITPTREIYGLGERFGPLQYKDGTYSMFILGQNGPERPAQGHQSMYLCKEYSGLYHVNLLKNVNAQEVVVQGQKITWKTIGGVYDFHFFLGDSPESALEKYHEYIGAWSLPAFWHLGSHQSKPLGLSDVGQLEKTLEKYEKAGIPLDSLWSNMDLYEKNENFNINTDIFPSEKMQQLFAKYNKKWIPVAQPTIPTSKNNPLWKFSGDISQFTIKDGLSHEPLTGYESSGSTQFIDFLHPNISKFWDFALDSVYNKVPAASGLWLDNNEPTNLMKQYKESTYFKNIKQRKFYNLPFYPNGVDNLYNLPIINLDSTHYGNIEEYNIRSLTAFYQSLHTYNYLKSKPGTYFPLVLSRGNMFGMGQFSSHSITNLPSTWNSLHNSLSSILSYQIFGIPMVGTEICGSTRLKKTDGELCARWYQLSVFYSFARNSRALYSQADDDSQEPYDAQTFASIKKSVQLRYSLLKQYYTFFFERPGKELRLGTILRPLFFEFHDKTVPKYGSKVHEEQFLLSDVVMVAPVLYQGKTSRQVYFPDCKWYDLRDGKEVLFRGRNGMVNAGIEEEVPYFLRAGKMVLKQDVEKVKSTEDLGNVFNVTAGLTDFVTGGGVRKAEAKGKILDVKDYSEEVVYKECVEKGCMMNITVVCEYNENELTMILSSSSQAEDREENQVEISWINLLGVEKGLKEKGNVEEKENEYRYDKESKVLSIEMKEKLKLKNNSKYVFKIQI